MAKKKASRRSAADDERDDTSSIASASTGYGGVGVTDYEDDELDVFQAMLDDLFEKRGSTREKALDGLISALRECVREEDCLANDSTITSRCVHSLRKGSAAEAASAATLLGLHMVTIAMHDSSSYDDAASDLSKAAAQGKTPAVRIAATEALAVSTFAACEDDHETLAVMRHVAAIWRDASPKVQAAAVAGWSLLFTSLTRGVSSPLVEQSLEQLGALLHAPDVALRAAAGEAIALLYNSCGFAGSDEDSWSDDEEVMSLASDTTGMSGLDEVVVRMQELASNKGDGVKRSRKGRSALKSTFRGLCAALEDGRVPQQRVRLQHGDTLCVSSLEGNLQLNALRHFLAGGFQAHLQHNGLLHGVFNFTPLQERGSKLSSLEKRAVRGANSAASKGRSRDRDWERSAKAQMRGGW